MSDTELVNTFSRLLQAVISENGESGSVVWGKVLDNGIACRFNNPIMVSMKTCQKVMLVSRAKGYDRWPGEVRFYWR